MLSHKCWGNQPMLRKTWMQDGFPKFLKCALVRFYIKDTWVSKCILNLLICSYGLPWRVLKRTRMREKSWTKLERTFQLTDRSGSLPQSWKRPKEIHIWLTKSSKEVHMTWWRILWNFRSPINCVKDFPAWSFPCEYWSSFQRKYFSLILESSF